MTTTRLKEIKGTPSLIEIGFHWCFVLEVFTDDLKDKQFNWKDRTFNITPWEVCELPIRFGVKRGGDNRIICEVNSCEYKTTINQTKNAFSAFILNQ
jgi:hypothetical protein